MKQEKKDNNKKIEPTRSELEILQVLWEHGPATVRFVNDKLKSGTIHVDVKADADHGGKRNFKKR